LFFAAAYGNWAVTVFQEYSFILLDIFRETMENKSIENEPELKETRKEHNCNNKKHGHFIRIMLFIT
jgi:hypothetical protein